MRDLIVRGMSGLGDCIHQRALVRQLTRTYRVWLRTPWPSVYHDLVGDTLQLLPPDTQLRTQLKNAKRQAALYTRRRPGAVREIQVTYPAAMVRAEGSVLAAMLRSCNADPRESDFTLPIPQSWHARADEVAARWRTCKPILFYRPLNERTEWGGCQARNPDHAAYADLVESVRDRYFVVSVADLEPGKEWPVGRDIGADAEYHAGELDFEVNAALVASAGLVYTSPGFAMVLAQAVGTPAACVFGGYEDACSFSSGAHLAPFLPIEPVNPCNCFQHDHACDKRIDMPAALQRIKDFTDEFADRQPLAA
jgi:ADP-heptose:LPS heptosyltransferase